MAIGPPAASPVFAKWVYEVGGVLRRARALAKGSSPGLIPRLRQPLVPQEPWKPKASSDLVASSSAPTAGFPYAPGEGRTPS
jgi:hypothetical protein